MSQISFYNTLTRKIEPIKPTQGETVGMYCCGPTVYAQAHIGNFRTFLLQDVMRRSIQIAGFKVIHVRNLTDVDDKTIQRAIDENKPLAQVTEYWTSVFHRDCERLNLLPPQIEPKATEHIREQIEMIQSLMDKGHAYQSEEGSVYFRVSSFSEYGALSRVKERELTTNTARGPIDSDEYERDSMADFVMWKRRKASDGDVYWDSPWGEGRPGWHLECSAMSMKYLGSHLDIHSGGVDLTFPHHENEIAQSECSCGHKFFKHWIHTSHLLVEGEKMSKSLGNMYTVDDIEAKGFAPVALRYALTSGHYRQTINFTMDSLHAAEQALSRLRTFSDECLKRVEWSRSKLLKSIYESYYDEAPWGPLENAWSALSHDLNVSGALGSLFSAIKSFRFSDASKAEIGELAIAFHKLIYALGYDLDAVATKKPSQEAPEEIRALAEQRWSAKQSKDWETADQLRNAIESKGWKVLDKKDGFEIEQI